jgi:hypothetical protein
VERSNAGATERISRTDVPVHVHFPGRQADERLGFSSYFSQRKALTGKSGRVVATMQMPGVL